MPIVVLIHNPHDRKCRELVDQVRGMFPRFEIYEFQTLRGLVWVQGAPCLWLFRPGADIYTEEPVYRQDIEVDLPVFVERYEQLKAELGTNEVPAGR